MCMDHDQDGRPEREMVQNRPSITTHDLCSPGIKSQGHTPRLRVTVTVRVEYWLTAINNSTVLLSRHQLRASAARRATWRGRGRAAAAVESVACGRGNAVTWSVWRRSSIDGSLFVQLLVSRSVDVHGGWCRWPTNGSWCSSTTCWRPARSPTCFQTTRSRTSSTPWDRRWRALASTTRRRTAGSTSSVAFDAHSKYVRPSPGRLLSRTILLFRLPRRSISRFSPFFVDRQRV